MGLNFTAVIVLARVWWAFVLRGVLAILFGVLAFLNVALAAIALVALFAAWAIIDGVTGLIAGWRTRSQDRNWWWSVVEGLLGIAAGIIAVLLPATAAVALVLVIGAWAVITGAIEIYGAIKLRAQISGELWLVLAGIGSILFGLLLFIFPTMGVVTLTWLIGGFALVFGVLLIMLGLRLRTIHGQAVRNNEYAERGIE
ncbi:MAG TPA: DUF308 domain-containing protein [Candidatus Limnocylindria bacterium]|nr:DUF308 domain-containing protein [Candidatus Limnocylindria bacterium]